MFPFVVPNLIMNVQAPGTLAQEGSDSGETLLRQEERSPEDSTDVLA